MLKEKLLRTFGFIHHHSLAQKALFKSYLRFFDWQIQTFFNKGLIKKRFIGTVKFYAKKGLTGITGNIYTGLHEFEDMGFLLHFLRPEDTFFDIGANVGSYSLLASGYIGAKTLSFEPSPATFNLLLKNIALNSLETKIQPHQIALAKEIGKLNFTITHDTGNHIANHEDLNEQIVEVAVKPLDTFIGREPILLKIDVEGFETDVIKGGEKILMSENLKAIIIELNGSGGRYGHDEKDIHAHLLSIGYLPYLYDPFKREFSLMNTFGSYNTIYIKDLPMVMNRCKNAEKVSALGIYF